MIKTLELPILTYIYITCIILTEFIIIFNWNCNNFQLWQSDDYTANHTCTFVFL
jgi:hypothetical protein